MKKAVMRAPRRFPVLDRESGRFAECVHVGRRYVIRYEDGTKTILDAREPLPERYEPQ